MVLVFQIILKRVMLPMWDSNREIVPVVNYAKREFFQQTTLYVSAQDKSFCIIQWPGDWLR